MSRSEQVCIFIFAIAMSAAVLLLTRRVSDLEKEFHNYHNPAVMIESTK